MQMTYLFIHGFIFEAYFIIQFKYVFKFNLFIVKINAKLLKKTLLMHPFNVMCLSEASFNRVTKHKIQKQYCAKARITYCLCLKRKSTDMKQNTEEVKLRVKQRLVTITKYRDYWT